MSAVTFKTPATGQHNLKLLLEQLRYHEIKLVRIHFSGSNDDGDMYVAEVLSIDEDVKLGQSDLDNIYVTGARMGTQIGYDGKVRDWIKKPPSLRELAVEVCDSSLELEHSGWEIDRGSYGEFIFEPLAAHEKRATALLDFHYNESDYDDYEGEEYNDE